MRHAASGLDGSRGCACYSTLRLDPETRGAVPRAGLRHSILPLPRACSCGCCTPSTQAKETLMEGVSVPSIIEDEKASEKDASKNRAP
jgi:hypothetical protein